MKGYIKQHRPNSIDVSTENVSISFNTLEELLNIDFVSSFKSIVGFYRFSIANNYDEFLLIAEYKNGNEWWVVGRIYEADISDQLPKWKAQ